MLVQPRSGLTWRSSPGVPTGSEGLEAGPGSPKRAGVVKSRLSVASELEQFARAIFEAMGATSATAAEVAAHLVRANLSGHDSHGIQLSLIHI